MTVTVSADGVCVLQGDCPLEDAEVLCQSLSHEPHMQIDWSGCTRLHTAVFQVLMAARPRIVGSPTDPFVQNHLVPFI